MSESDPAYATTFGLRIEDLVIPATQTPIWDEMVEQFGDPIPHLPAPSWPETPDQKVTDESATNNSTDQ